MTEDRASHCPVTAQSPLGSPGPEAGSRRTTRDQGRLGCVQTPGCGRSSCVPSASEEQHPSAPTWSSSPKMSEAWLSPPTLQLNPEAGRTAGQPLGVTMQVLGQMCHRTVSSKCDGRCCPLRAAATTLKRLLGDYQHFHIGEGSPRWGVQSALPTFPPSCT